MAIERISHTPPPVVVTPTPEQLERLEQRKRFRNRYIYAPVVVVTLLWLVAVVILLWLIVGVENEVAYRRILSGIADAIAILFLLPTVLLCAVPPLAVTGFFIYRRRQKRELPADVEQLPLTWRIENIITRVKAQLETTILPAIANPVITAYAVAAFVRTLLVELRKMVSREIDRYVGK